MSCIFCKIVEGKVPANIIKKSENSLAFLDAFPLAKGHSLVIPQRHYSKVQEMSDSDNEDLFKLVKDVLSKVDKLTGSTLVAIHNGKESGQEVPHVHVHLIPRSSRDSAGAVHSMFKERPTLTKKDTDELLGLLRE